MRHLISILTLILFFLVPSIRSSASQPHITRNNLKFHCSTDTVRIGNKRVATKKNPAAYVGCENTNIKIANIPSSVTYNGIIFPVKYIDYCAFKGCTGLTSVTIPNSVTSIDYCAFEGCTGLTSVTIPNSITRINDSAFASCKGLTSVTIPNSVTFLGEKAFFGCTNLTSASVGNSVCKILKKTFNKCKSLTTLTIGKNVETIESEALDYCFALKTIRMLNPYPPMIDGDLAIPQFVRENATLIVPAGSAKYYKTRPYWKEFVNIQEAQQ